MRFLTDASSSPFAWRCQLIGCNLLIVSRLIERIDVSTGYKVQIKFKISLKQFLGQE